MNESNELRDLGMNRRIPPRDFLNGVAVAIGGAYAASKAAPLAAAGLAAAPQTGAAAAGDYPPALTGLRGNYPEAIDAFGPMQRGAYRQFPALDLDTHEDYNLVISAPGMYHTSCGGDPGTSIGGYRGVTTADEPIVVRLVRNPNKPVLPRREQNRAGQQRAVEELFVAGGLA